MPRKPIDYSNTHFYKIVCKDMNINSLYVGHTTDFTARKYNHKKQCINPSDKFHNRFVYQTIRENGNWNNWDMVELETRFCESSLEARRIERDYIEQLNADLNVVKRPIVSLDERRQYKKEWESENKEHIQEQKRLYHLENREKFCEKVKKWRQENPDRRKEQAKTYREKHKEKLRQVIECPCGNSFSHNHKARHLKSQKHQEYLNQQQEN